MKNETFYILTSTTSGPMGGLEIHFHLAVSDGYDYLEILFQIHNKTSPPFNLESDGFWLKTGSWNYFQIERTFTFTERLSEPFNDCLKDVNLFKGNKTLINYILDSKRTYSQIDCYYKCTQIFALEESGC